MVWRNVLGGIEPESGTVIEQLTLERQRAQDPIEGANAIGYDDVALTVAGGVVVADLSFVTLTELIEMSTFENVGKDGFNDGTVY